MTLPIQRGGRLRPAGRALPCVLVLASATATAMLYPGRPALASPPSGLIVVPRPASQPALSYFKLQARAGSLGRAGVIELRNPGSSSLRVVLSPVDGETLGTLGSGYAPPGSRAHRSALWLRLQRRAVALAPKASATVPVSSIVPALAKPGDYLSGVSIEALDQRSRAVKRRGVSIASVARYVIGVEVSVPGPRHPLIRFTGAQIQRQPAGLTFLLHARNPGNVVLQGVHGYVRITRGGRPVASQPISSGTFVTQTQIAYPVNAFREAPKEGTRYRITAWMRYPGGIARLDSTVAFGHRQAAIQKQYAHARTPSGGTAWWKIAGVAAAVLYGLLTTVLLLRRRSRDPREALQP